MKDFRLALIQHDSYVGHKAENLARTVAWVEKAKDRGAELVCFPELNLTGHAGHPSTTHDFEPVPDGDCVKTLLDLARRLNIHICAGICEDDLGIPYNTQFLVGPDGYIGKQRKLHLSMDEYFLFRAGTLIKTFDLPMARIGMIICYDNSFPEMSRCLALQGAEVLLCPHAARHTDANAFEKMDDLEYRKSVVKSQKEDFIRLHSCRSHDNGCYVGLCNMIGNSARDYPGVPANHAGGCLAFDPNGSVIGISTSEDLVEEMIVVDLAGHKYHDRRSERNFNLKTRRPELYGKICEPTE